jgi:putative membrane protein
VTPDTKQHELDDPDPSRRTILAAERTWLAWWRSGIAAATASVAVGGLIPQLVNGSRWPYELLGAGYALLAVAVFVLAWARQRRVEDGLARGEPVRVEPGWIVAMTAGGGVLALATLLIVVLQP